MDRALQLNPRFDGAMIELGRLQLAGRDVASAIGTLRAALQVAPGNGVAHANLGAALALWAGQHSPVLPRTLENLGERLARGTSREGLAELGRASVEAFALELAGYPKVKVFVRGWEQWSADEKAPVEK